MPTRKLASFPNSRNKPRPATRTATPFEVSLPGSGVVGTPGAPVKILDANENRTYFTLINIESVTNQIRFMYAPEGTEGTPPATITTQGFPIVPGLGLGDEQSPEELWAVNMCNVDGNAVTLNGEEGEG